MFKGAKISVPILGLVENMAWFTPEELPENKYYIFGKGGCEALAKKMDMNFLAQIPIVQSIREGGDSGVPAAADSDSIIGKVFTDMSQKVIEIVKDRNTNFNATKIVEIDPNASCGV